MNGLKRELQRTMSLTDVNTSSLIRDVVERDLTIPADRSKHRFFLNMPKYDLILPSLSRFDQDFRKFLCSALVDFPLLKELEEANCLNWCPALPKFLPLLTVGDGNCLMNAASLSMWAINDRRLTLRKSVYQVLIEDQTDIFRNRWQLEQAKRFEDQYGSPVDCSEDEWLRDWKKTVEMASTKMSTDTKCLSGLEEIHIFVLSNVLRRPIVILCDDVLRGNYDESLADVNMGGIYLPLLSDSVDCVKSPLVIGYHQGHFTALVTTEDGSIDMTGDEQFWRNKSNNAVPLVKNDGSAMKMQFLLPEEKQHSNQLLREYLDCSEVEHNDSEGNETILVAIMQSQEPEPHLDQIFKKYFDALQAVYLEKLAEKLYWSSNKQAKDAQCKTSIHGNTPSPSDVTYPSKESDWSGLSAEIKTGKPPVPCCSVHKRCKTTGCKYYTTQGHDLCYRCKKHEKQMCTSPGCEFRANPGYQGLCSTCFTRYHAIMEQGKNTAKPSAPPSNFCRSKNCQKQASPALLNFCVDCYLSTIQNLNLEDVIAGPAGEWNSSTGTQLSNQPSVAASSVKKFSKDVPNEAASKNVPSATAVPVGKISRQVSLFCSNKNCHNHLENSTSLYCNECMENMATSMPSSPSIKICHKSGCSGIVNSGVSDDMCNSCLNNLQGANGFHQPNVQSSSTTTFDICSISGCTMPAVTYHGELCLAHYQQSQSFHRNQQQRNYDPLYGSQCESLFKAQGTLCINTGCTFYGDPDNNYLCSYCHSKALQEQYDMERIKLEQDRAQAEWLARTAQYSGSSAYGFYELKNLVPQHYHFDNSGITPRKPFYIQASCTPKSSNSAPPSPKLRAKWSRATTPCLTEGCPHFGTAQNKGLCEVCIRKQESTHPTATGRSRFCSTP